MNTFLVGEVGLEQTHLKIVKVKVLSSQTTVINEAHLDNKDYNSILHLLTEFLEGNSAHAKGILVVPGLVVENRFERRTGFRWKSIDGIELAKALQIPFFRLISKVEAISLYYKFLKNPEIHEFNPQFVTYPDKRLFVYLGEEVQTSISVLTVGQTKSALPDQKVLLSAVGNTSFCPRTPFDFDFQQFLKKELALGPREMPSFQHMLSNKGIVNIYRFVCLKTKQEVPPNFGYANFVTELTSGSSAAEEAAQYYFEVLGNFLYTAALSYLPEGGIYLFGADFCRMVAFFRDYNPLALETLKNNFLLDGHLKPRFSEFRLCAYIGESDLDFDKVLKYL